MKSKKRFSLLLAVIIILTMSFTNITIAFASKIVLTDYHAPANQQFTKAIHIGGFKFKHGSNYVTYPNTIVFNVGTGGTWTHYLDQNPLRVFHNYNDLAGKYTPRAIDNDDINNRGGHYLVYHLNTDTVKEFVSGLSIERSTYGDKKEPTLY